MTLFCAYDTETTGIHNPIYHVEVGAVLILVDAEFNARELASFSLIVRPEDYRVPVEATNIHGISHDIAEQAGVPPIVALATLTNLWSRAEIRVEHNAEYDNKVI